MSLHGVGSTTAKDIYWGPNTHGTFYARTPGYSQAGLLGHGRWELRFYPAKVRHLMWPEAGHFQD